MKKEDIGEIKSDIRWIKTTLAQIQADGKGFVTRVEFEEHTKDEDERMKRTERTIDWAQKGIIGTVAAAIFGALLWWRKL